MRIIVSSMNPVKINATREAFTKCFPKELIEVEAISVPSGVADQPMSEKETLQGAKNRVQNAMKKIPNADFWVGIEGGVNIIDGDMASVGWVVVQGRTGTGKMKTGKARTNTMFLPLKVCEMIKNGEEMGYAADKVFGKTGTKHKNGIIGLLTKDIFTRTETSVNALVIALIPFMNPELY